MKLRVVVLGADGFIGRHVAAALDATDWAQAVRTSRRQPLPATAATTRQVDATDDAALRSAFVGADAVVNCVAGSASTIIDGARALFAAAAAQPVPPLVVHLSSMAVYGRVDASVDESSPLRPDLGQYAAAKIEAERIAARYPRCVILRPGIVYGPGSALWSELVGRLLLARRLGELGDAGSGICNLVYVGDVAAATIESLRRPAALGLAVNLAGPAPAPAWNEYFARYAQALHATPLRRIGPLRLQWELRVLGPLLTIGARLSGGAGRRLPPAIRPWLLEQCGLRLRMPSERAAVLLGLQWTPLATGLQAAAHGLLEHA